MIQVAIDSLNDLRPEFIKIVKLRRLTFSAEGLKEDSSGKRSGSGRFVFPALIANRCHGCRRTFELLAERK